MSEQKVIEVLETIKTFMNIKNVFYYCCDDVVEKALIEEK